MNRTNTRSGWHSTPMTQLGVGGLVATLLGAAVVIAVSFAASSPGASARPSGDPSVDWVACEGAPDAECGSLEVPLDWARPDGTQVTVAVARRPADDPDRRIGTLFFNPGGPGDGAVRYVEGAQEIFSDRLLSRFD